MTAPPRIEPEAAHPAGPEAADADDAGQADMAPPAAAPAAVSPPGWRRLHRVAADAVFALLLLALVLTAGWLAARHDHTFDWSSSARNSLSPESIALLERLPDGAEAPLRITVFAPREHRVGRAVEALLARYRRHRPDLDIQWVDPQTAPGRARNADVHLLGQLVLEQRGRRETLEALSEGTLSSAIARLTLERAPWVAVLEGHGERAMAGGAGADIGRFAQLLRQRGFRLRPLDLASAGRVPDNTDLLVVTAPSIALFPGEAEALVDYLDAGGNLLWLLDPGASTDGLMGLEPLAAYLGVRPLPGMVVDAQASELGFEAPTFAVLDDWPAHPLGRDLKGHVVLPGSLAFAPAAAPGWLLDTTLTTGADSWNETGPIRGEITRNPAAGEQAGPLALALVLTRPRPAPARAADADAGGEPAAPAEQRVILVGDGDFASNAHLATAGNRELALRMARWLTGLEDLITPPAAPDDRDNFVLSTPRAWAIAVGGVFVLPALLVAAGLWITWRRGTA
ncbi:GldG family protein [uncultured Thiohalocapsa sp.]|uniref:GldG family protein n=1 Tax=uncultured Thiohalocapsa sp. TaxID=768990 RepID=UPI0025E9F99C|nr:GldG family protein [uncultured Thiohalocapsa sp.]